jgi:hypothetical protein
MDSLLLKAIVNMIIKYYVRIEDNQKPKRLTKISQLLTDHY